MRPNDTPQLVVLPLLPQLQLVLRLQAPEARGGKRARKARKAKVALPFPTRRPHRPRGMIMRMLQALRPELLPDLRFRELGQRRLRLNRQFSWSWDFRRRRLRRIQQHFIVVYMSFRRSI